MEMMFHLKFASASPIIIQQQQQRNLTWINKQNLCLEKYCWRRFDATINHIWLWEIFPLCFIDISVFQ